MPRVIASIEARMGASRLPGKVLADICGQPALTRLLRRLKKCRLLDGIVLATSTNPKDDPLIVWAEAEGVEYFRGSENDVLNRVVEAQRKMQSDIVVEIWGDMPLLDPEIVDLGIKTFLGNECDVVATTWKQSYPGGIDVVTFKYSDLAWVDKNISDSAVREHVSLYFFEHPEKFRIIHLFAPESLEAPVYRFVLDYPEDLQFIREVYTKLEPLYGDDFGVKDILQLLKKNPQLLEINRHCLKKSAP